MTTPTLDQIIEATGGELSRDEDAVIVSYGSIGYYSLTPDYIIRNGQELPAVSIRGKLMKQDGKHHADLRETLRSNGLEIA